MAHQIGGAVGIGLGGLSVSEFGSYAPAIVVVTLVVLLGGLAQLRIPASLGSNLGPIRSA